jgi:hypothetical protein
MSSYFSSNPLNFFSFDMNLGQYRSIIRNSAGTLVQIKTGSTADSQVLQHFIYDRANIGVGIDGNTLATATAALGDIGTSANGLAFGAAPQPGLYVDGSIQEIIVYNSDQSENRADIESNINTFYSIY